MAMHSANTHTHTIIIVINPQLPHTHFNYARHLAVYPVYGASTIASHRTHTKHIARHTFYSRRQFFFLSRFFPASFCGSKKQPAESLGAAVKRSVRVHPRTSEFVWFSWHEPLKLLDPRCVFCKTTNRTSQSGHRSAESRNSFRQKHETSRVFAKKNNGGRLWWRVLYFVQTVNHSYSLSLSTSLSPSWWSREGGLDEASGWHLFGEI